MGAAGEDRGSGFSSSGHERRSSRACPRTRGIRPVLINSLATGDPRSTTSVLTRSPRVSLESSEGRVTRPPSRWARRPSCRRSPAESAAVRSTTSRRGRMTVMRLAIVMLLLVPALAFGQAKDDKTTTRSPTTIRAARCRCRRPRPRPRRRSRTSSGSSARRRGSGRFKSLYTIPEDQALRFVDGEKGFIIPVERKRRLDPRGAAAGRPGGLPACSTTPRPRSCSTRPRARPS